MLKVKSGLTIYDAVRISDRDSLALGCTPNRSLDLYVRVYMVWCNRHDHLDPWGSVCSSSGFATGRHATNALQNQTPILSILLFTPWTPLASAAVVQKPTMKDHTSKPQTHHSKTTLAIIIPASLNTCTRFPELAIRPSRPALLLRDEEKFEKTSFCSNRLLISLSVLA